MHLFKVWCYSPSLFLEYAHELLARHIKCRGIALCGDVKHELVYKVGELRADMLVTGCCG